MIFLEMICFEFPCIDGAHFPKIGGSFFPKVGGSFPQNRWLIFSQSRWLIFPKSVAHFPRSRWLIFSQSGSLIFPKSVADFHKVGRWFSQRPTVFVRLVVDFSKWGRCVLLPPFAWGFGKAKGSLWTWWHTSCRGSVKKQKNIRTWRTAEISLFACSALQQLESRNCSAETFEFVHDRQIHTTMIQSLHFTHWVASCLLILMCIGVCHTCLSTFFTHSSHHYLKFLLIRSNIEDCSLAYVICTCKFWLAAWEVSELNPHSQELLHLSLWYHV